MKGIISSRLLLIMVCIPLFACGRKEESQTGEGKERVKEAVEQAVTKEFKTYDGAKEALRKIERDTREKREKEIQPQ